MFNNNTPRLKALPKKTQKKTQRTPMKHDNLGESLTANRLLEPLSNSTLLRGRVALVPRLHDSPVFILRRLSKKKKTTKSTQSLLQELNQIKREMEKQLRPSFSKETLFNGGPLTSQTQTKSLQTNLKVNKIVIDELEPEEIKKLKGKDRIKKAEMEESLMDQRKEEFQQAKCLPFSEFQIEESFDNEEENSFVRSTSPEGLIPIIINKFMEFGITTSSLEKFIADVIFLVEQDYKTLSYSYNSEILITVICEALLFGTLKLEEHTKKALVILFQSIEDALEGQNLDTELLISNAFQVWQKFHKKRNPLQSHVLGCLCNLARRIRPQFYFFPDSIRILFLSSCLETIGTVLTEGKTTALPAISVQRATGPLNRASNSSRSAAILPKNELNQGPQVQHKLHWLLDTGLKNTVTRISINSNFIAKGALLNLVTSMKKLLGNNGEILISSDNSEMVLDYLAVWGLLLKNNDTLALIERGKEKETLGKSLNSFLRVINEHFIPIIQTEKTENLTECLGIFSQVFQNRKFYEMGIMPWDERLPVQIVKILTKPFVKRAKHHSVLLFKRRTYCLAAEKISKMLFWYLTLGASAFSLNLSRILPVFKAMIDETISFLQEDKCFCFNEARNAAESLLALLDHYKPSES